MKSKNRKQLDEILEYAAERGIHVPGDILLDVADKETKATVQDFKIPPESMPLFTKNKPGAVPPYEKDGQLILSNSGWVPPMMETRVIGFGGGSASAAAEVDPVFTASEAFNFVAGDKGKLDGIETGAEVNNMSDSDVTDLTDSGATTLHTHAETDPVFLASEAFSFAAGDKGKLDGIEAGAEVNNISDSDATDLTDGGATTLHTHAESDPVFLASEAFSFAAGDKNKLDGIEASADVNNISDSDATDLTGGSSTTLHTHALQQNIQFQDDGTNRGSSGGINVVNFVGAGVSATSSTDVLTVTIVGGAGEAFPVGSVFLAVVNTDPNTLLGYGTWAAFGAGKMLVGRDAGDTDFDTAEGTGGAKTKTIAQANLPNISTGAGTAHTHVQNQHRHQILRERSATTGSDTTQIARSADASSTLDTAVYTEYTTPTNQDEAAHTHSLGGSGTALNVVNPYIVVYMWKRTA